MSPELTRYVHGYDMFKHPKGTWVLYREAQARIVELERELTEMKERIEKAPRLKIYRGKTEYFTHPDPRGFYTLDELKGGVEVALVRSKGKEDAD